MGKGRNVRERTAGTRTTVVNVSELPGSVNTVFSAVRRRSSSCGYDHGGDWAFKKHGHFGKHWHDEFESGTVSGVISERFPGLMDLCTEDKKQLIREIWQSLIKEEAPNLPADFVELLNDRVEYHLAHPGRGTPWEDIWECIDQKKAELGAQQPAT